MDFPKPGFNLRKAIDQINAGDDLNWLPNDRLCAVIFGERVEFLGYTTERGRTVVVPGLFAAVVGTVWYGT